VLTPILLAVLEYTRVGLSASGEAIGGHWLGSLIAFDVIFVAQAGCCSKYVVEE